VREGERERERERECVCVCSAFQQNAAFISMRFFFLVGGAQGVWRLQIRMEPVCWHLARQVLVVESLGFRVYIISERCFATSFSDFFNFFFHI
jgi:hypothetical protein